MINLRIARQQHDYDCGAAALQVVMEYYGVGIRGDRLRRALKTDINGTSYVNMVAVAEKYGFKVLATKDFTLERLKRFVDEDTPVIVAVQAWADRYMTIAEWRKDYNDGHYVVVVGHQNGIIIFEDPSSWHHTWLTEREFLARWHDRDAGTGVELEQFGIVLTGKQPVERTPKHMD